MVGPCADFGSMLDIERANLCPDRNVDSMYYRG